MERVTRLAEELYHTENYFTIIEGMNRHTPFYQDGFEWMKTGDLVAEKSAEECLDEIVEYITQFTIFVESTLTPTATRFLWEKRNRASGTFL